MKFVSAIQRGRFGNAIFRFLASRLFCIFLDYNISYTEQIQYYQNLDDEIFIDWMNHFLKEKTIKYYECSYLFFTGFYQHDMIYRFFKKNLIKYIKEHPNEKIETDRNEIYYANDIWNHKFKPNFILIDGRLRVLCFLVSLKRCSPGTKIIFDDYASRKYYHIVEELIKPKFNDGRQCLFEINNKKKIDMKKLDFLINKFNYILD